MFLSGYNIFGCKLLKRTERRGREGGRGGGEGRD